MPEEFKHLVRLGGVVIDGNLNLWTALQRIEGIGFMLSMGLLRELGFDWKRKLGTLGEEELRRLEEGIKNIDKLLPAWMLNRRRDSESGENKHVIGSDLKMALRRDIERMQRIKCYRGVRHAMGLPVRGQRTRTSFRKGRTVGVMKKKKK